MTAPVLMETTETPVGAETVVAPVDVVACAAFSAAGAGLAPLAAVADGRLPAGTEAGALPGDPAAYPPAQAVLPVSGFRPEEVLGRKGLSRLTRTEQLAAAACTLALEGPAGPAASDTGIVLGTSVGSARALAEFTRDTFVQERPYYVNPSQFPGTLMNAAAGRTAIRHGLTGVNATVSGGPLAALHAVRYARGALLNGHADRLLTGAVEELSAHTAWAWRRSGALAPGVPLGEGAAVFALQRAGSYGTGQRPVARLLACETGFANPSEGLAHVGRRLAACVRTALRRSGVAPEEVTVVAPGAAGRRGWSAVEDRALREVFGTSPRTLRVQPVLGETHSAGAGLQLAAVLATWRTPATERDVALITSIGPDGSVGCLVAVRPGA
ncbi:3-oxoacyl-ACP synthase [Streptomyces mashuensis]|uniref:3-oxoacyl-ACP synthase n=1 Tax=Streptomyces mashuensis TaxID=33904 RepID=A0A919B294_9ACTN|nr:beta-ketoacyl synthase N-terminal-like domain-containing protein [Streptomyces mashuensis]GHF41990.1 3-oxoacyl-ACP synthase [Streptomyces mashuensis]